MAFPCCDLLFIKELGKLLLLLSDLKALSVVMGKISHQGPGRGEPHGPALEPGENLGVLVLASARSDTARRVS
jgi:hypothetical protein